MSQTRDAGLGVRISDEPDLTEATVLAIFAHPDDESLACGGTLARLSDAGAAVIVLCASRGELGCVSEPSQVPEDNLRAARTRELHAAAEVLGLKTVLVFDYPDGELYWADESQLNSDILTAIRRYNVDAVITFDEDGLYWHADHVAVHERTSKAMSSLGAEAPVLYYVTMAPGSMRSVVDNAISRGWAPPAAGLWSIEPAAFGVATHAPAFSIDNRPWVSRKLAALQCHRTQFGSVNPFSLLNHTDASEWLGFEYFRRAPIGGRGEPLLEQLARGIPEDQK
jgi:LmbE family N-acetylglucosaminyl deacetylase